MAEPHLIPPTESEAADLRRAFQEAGYIDTEIIKNYGSMEFPSRRQKNLGRLLHITQAGRPSDVLMRLFLLNAEIPTANLERILGKASVETLRRIQLLEDRADQVLARSPLLPLNGNYVAFDSPEKVARSAAEDHVIGITGAGTQLDNFTIRRPSKRTLDLGCGSGILAFSAAAHSDEVYGVDKNQRAVDFANFNTALNSLSNVKCVQGDGFGPVAGMEFDLIVANLPFVIAPKARFTYRDSGMRGDQFVRAVIRDSPAHLSEGGFLQLICQWPVESGREWRSELARWFEGLPCDVLVLTIEQLDITRYAQGWIRDTESDDPAEAAELYEEWMRFFESQRIEGVGSGLIALRKRTGVRNWVHIDEAPENLNAAFSEAVLARFRRRDFLESQDDKALLAARLVASPAVRLSQIAAPSRDRWKIASAQLRLIEGMQYGGNVDAFVANFLPRCDGSRPVRELIAQSGAAVGADPARVTAPFLKLLRQLTDRGFVEPASHG